jgi:hypothetical protein
VCSSSSVCRKDSFFFAPSSGNTIRPAVLFPTFSFEDYVGYISSVAIIMTMRRRRRRRGSVGRKIGGKKTSIDALRLVALAGTHTHTLDSFSLAPSRSRHWSSDYSNSSSSSASLSWLIELGDWELCISFSSSEEDVWNHRDKKKIEE